MTTILLINMQGLYLWGTPAVKVVALGIIFICSLVLLAAVSWRDPWWKKMGLPAALILATIATYLTIGTATFLFTENEWRETSFRDILRQSFFALVLLATLRGGDAILERIGFEGLMLGILMIQVASCLIVLTTPLLQYLDVLVTFRLPFRMTGAFTDPNDAGLVACMTVVLAFVLSSYGKWIKFSYVALALGCVAALMSFSRTAIVMVLGLPLFLSLLGGDYGLRRLAQGLITSGLLVVIVFALFAQGVWPLRNLVLGQDLEAVEFCLPVPPTTPALLSDCNTLLSAQDTLAGDITLNWRRTMPIDVWQGVVVGGTERRVTELNLQGMGLSGRIPPGLAELEQLAALRLANNALTGSVPLDLAKLPHLEEVLLQGNALSEGLPGRETVVASGPQFGHTAAGTRNEAEVAAALEPEIDWTIDYPAGLFCRSGQIDAALLRDCSLLLAARDTLADGGLTLNWNRDIPIGAWQGVGLGGPEFRVTELKLTGVGLRGRIPPALGDLEQLVVLSLASNQLRGRIPPELSKLENLRVLSLAFNRLTGPLPPGLSSLSELDELWLQSNYLTNVGDQLRENGTEQLSPRLQLYGPRPESYKPLPLSYRASDSAGTFLCRPGQAEAGLLSDCGTLLAVRDSLAGSSALNWSRDLPVGAWWGVIIGEPYKRVVELSLPGMGLNGRIPPGLGDLEQLVVLRLSSNLLGGEIPPELSKLENLQVLSLTRNQLTGSVPPELVKLTNLQELWLAYNQLTLPFPPAIFYVKYHDLLDTAFCLPSGPQLAQGLLSDCGTLLAVRDTLGGDIRLSWSEHIPVGFWEGVVVGARGIVALDLVERGMNGRIPPELGDLEQLVELRFSRNRLTDAIPATLGKLDKLRVLALEDNALSGIIPEELKRRDLSLRIEGNDFGILAGLGASRRLAMWTWFLENRIQSPFFGDGLGSFRSMAGSTSNAQGSQEGIHNLFLMLVGDAGVVPLVLYCLFLLSLLILYWTKPASAMRNITIGWAAVLATFGMAYHHLLSQGSFIFMCGLCCVLAKHLYRRDSGGALPSAQA